MRKPLLIGSAAAALFAIPVIAIAADAPGKGPGMEPMTRAAVEAKVKERFAAMDANKDGAVTQEEIRSQMQAHWAERRAQHFAAMDTNKDGSISRAEFDAFKPEHGKGEGEGHHGMKKKMGGKGMMGHMGGRMFGMADANKDGKVTQAEATNAALAHFDMVDTNKDGTISPDEHKAARDAMRQKWKDGAKTTG